MAGWDKPLTSWIDEIEREVNAEIVATAEQAFQKVLEKTPVATGNLKAGWNLKITEEAGIASATIENNVEYAEAVEYGTPDRPPTPMIESTIQELEGVHK